MGLFWKAAAGAFITVILGLVLGKQEKDLSMILVMAASSMICALALTYLEPVLEFMQELQNLGDLNGDILGLLLKTAGIGIVAELAALICVDAGNASMGKALQLLGSAVILCLSLPIFRTVLELIQRILGEI